MSETDTTIIPETQDEIAPVSTGPEIAAIEAPVPDPTPTAEMLEKMIQMNSFAVYQREDAEQKLKNISETGGESRLNITDICYQQNINILYDPARSEEEFENFLFNFMSRYHPNKNIYMVYICYPGGKQVSTIYVRDKRGRYSQESSEGRVMDEAQWKKVILVIDAVGVYCMKGLILDLMNLDNVASNNEIDAAEGKVLKLRDE